MQRLDGVDHVTVDLARGEAVVVAEQGRSLEPIQIRDAVRQAGFSLRQLTVVAEGRLRTSGASTALEVSGEVSWPLKGEVADRLAERTDLKDRRIRVTADLEFGTDGAPATLLLRTFEPL